MAKKLRMAPELQAPAATIVPETRDVQAEQTSQQQTLDTTAAVQKQQAETAAKDTAVQQANFKRAMEAAEQQQRQEREVQRKRPLTEAEQQELIYLEKLAMQSGNRPAETMHRLADLRIRSKVASDTQTT